jgi:hypothetical protein
VEMTNTDIYSDRLERLLQKGLSLLDGIRESQWTWSVSAREWSIAQCIDHIITVNALVEPRLAAAVQRGLDQHIFSPGPFRYPLFDRLFAFALDPRTPVKQRAPGIYLPSSLPGLKESRERFLSLQQRLIEAAHASANLDLVKIKIASPVSDRLRFSLGTWLAAVAAHEDNHLQQAIRVTREAKFPVH